MIPGVKVKVLKVTAPEKVDKDLISKVIEQIIEEDDKEKDNEIENSEVEDEIKSESDQESDVIELDGGSEEQSDQESEEQNEIAVKFVVGGLVKNMSNGVSSKDMLRVPAKLDKKGRSTFSFSVEKDDSDQDTLEKEQPSVDGKSKRRGRRRMENIMFDLTKFIGREKIPLKVNFMFLHAIFCILFFRICTCIFCF